jgi:hypothetical protein
MKAETQGRRVSPFNLNKGRQPDEEEVLRDDLSSSSETQVEKPEVMQRDNSASRLSDRSAGSTNSRKKNVPPIDPKSQTSPRVQVP